ncbi:MAG: exo-alpha-sialidase [Chloroflexi bacterium]|nr:exo-alpha-sialidase [Chloroflexota bacterium]
MFQLTRRSLAVTAALLLALSWTMTASAATLIKLSTDPYTNTSSQHQTEVEPDSFSYGSTVVMVTQVGRFTDGGSSNIGWATSTDAGATWTNGFLPGITIYAGGIYARVSDPSVAYDAKHNVWLINSLPLTEPVKGAAVVVNRSTDGGLTWGNPINVSLATGSSDYDKNWIACDNGPASPFYGNCYVTWDNFGNGNRLLNSTSTDGGLTWGAAKATGNNASGIGAQPLARPNGAVIVPADDTLGNVVVYNSTNGGSTWGRTKKIATVSEHGVAGGLRSGGLPSAEIDASGKIYLVWQDCRFESGCSANDIVMTTSTTGSTWTAVTRIPIDTIGSSVDHFIPGIGVDRNTSGGSAHLGLTYYYYPAANCSASTCQLYVGFVSSTDGGATWSAKQTLAGPMTLSWLANTTQGRMVGDYVSTSFAGGTAHPAFANANAPTGGTFDEALYSVVGGLTPRSGVNRVAADPVLSTSSDTAARGGPTTYR